MALFFWAMHQGSIQSTTLSCWSQRRDQCEKSWRGQAEYQATDWWSLNNPINHRINKFDGPKPKDPMISMISGAYLPNVSIPRCLMVATSQISDLPGWETPNSNAARSFDVFECRSSFIDDRDEAYKQNKQIHIWSYMISRKIQWYIYIYIM